jgi:hypothetical protein
MDEVFSHIPDNWADALARSAEDSAAGRSVPVQQIIGELRSSAERLEARLANGKGRTPRSPARHG